MTIFSLASWLMGQASGRSATNPASVTAVLGAVAAAVAAVLSGLTLYLAGRRETRKWLRESQLDALTQFLDASFTRTSARTYDLRTQPTFNGDLTSYKEKSATAHQMQNDALTKMRFLASSTVIAAAEALHKADEAAADAALGDTLPSASDWATLRSSQRRARETLIVEARKGLGLGDSAGISGY